MPLPDECLRDLDADARIHEVLGARLAEPVIPYVASPGPSLPTLAKHDRNVALLATGSVVGVGSMLIRWLPGITAGATLSPDAPLTRAAQEEARALRWERASKLSVPAYPQLRGLDSTLADRFGQVARWETGLAPTEDCAQLVLLQSLRIEELLHQRFLRAADQSLSEVVRSHVDFTGAREAITSFITGESKATLWTVQCWLIGFARAVRAGETTAHEFLTARFVSPTSRYKDEHVITAEFLSRSGLPRFVGRMRERFRNPLAHGTPMTVSSEDYARFCDAAYATESVTQWLDLGVSPLWHPTQSAGWISVVVAAARP
jgi:hypothetical protein